MRNICLIAAAALALTASTANAADYFPPKGDAWTTHTAVQEGFDPPKLQAAIDFAVAHESKLSPTLDGVIDQRDLRITIPIQFAGPYSDPIGPLQPHAPANGIVIRHGYIVAEWGDTRAVDMAHWSNTQILSRKEVAMSRTPSGPNPGCGYLNWFLNTDKKLFPAAREDALAFIGNGDNIVFVDYQHDTVAVVRWIDDSRKAEFVRLLESSVR